MTVMAHSFCIARYDRLLEPVEYMVAFGYYHAIEGDSWFLGTAIFDTPFVESHEESIVLAPDLGYFRNISVYAFLEEIIS